MKLVVLLLALLVSLQSAPVEITKDDGYTIGDARISDGEVNGDASSDSNSDASSDSNSDAHDSQSEVSNNSNDTDTSDNSKVDGDNSAKEGSSGDGNSNTNGDKNGVVDAKRQHLFHTSEYNRFPKDNGTVVIYGEMDIYTTEEGMIEIDATKGTWIIKTGSGEFELKEGESKILPKGTSFEDAHPKPVFCKDSEDCIKGDGPLSGDKNIANEIAKQMQKEFEPYQNVMDHMKDLVDYIFSSIF